MLNNLESDEGILKSSKYHLKDIITAVINSSTFIDTLTQQMQTIFDGLDIRINEQGEHMKKLTNKINELDNIVVKQSEMIAVMKACSEKIQKEETGIKDKLNHLEQYDRRLNLRIFGIPEKSQESTDVVVLDLARKLDIPIDVADLSRSHRAGALISSRQEQKNKSQSEKIKHRALLVRFTSYRASKAFYSNRTFLNQVGCSNVIIREDLTKDNLNLLKYAQSQLKNVYLQYYVLKISNY
ncbi:unnamed protein product [Didymodactylos carnosus]|uniref:Uncharacterized protein n=1 Tax=Didymodactylos carnosus TaxID=1234261 RepID=A0A814NKU5_9BILA|nr:unnamed protein product [Didymodactylos carnosus]CAF3860362.1 unnamed protein product [Didymodactylos carnosus]